MTCASGDASSTVRMGHRLASGLLAFIAALGIASGPSFAVTTEQLLYLEAWRAVDR